MVFEHAHEHPSQWATIRSVDFYSPGRLDVFGRDVVLVETREQLGGHVRAFIHRKREGFAKKISRALRHLAILGSSLPSNLLAADGGWCDHEPPRLKPHVSRTCGVRATR
jgi:hypothetical protein